MRIEETIRLMKFMRNGYQKLIDENCAEGKVVGTDVTGTWKSSTPLTEVYQKHIDACDTAIEALEKQIPKKPVKSKKPRCGMGYDYYDWECPTCGSFLAFEPDLDRLKKVHHCKCGQAISYVED